MGGVIPFDSDAALAGDATAALPEDVDEVAARTARDPRWLDVLEIPATFRTTLTETIGRARRDLEPSRPEEVVKALMVLADRHRLDLPDARALEMDAETMAEWPRDLWTRAYRTVWERWSYRRMPTVGDFRSHLGDAIERRRRRYDLLTTLEAQLRARTKPRTVPECIAALERAGPGVRQGWFKAAMRRDPDLTPADRTDLARWVPAVAPRIASIGLFGPTDE